MNAKELKPLEGMKAFEASRKEMMEADLKAAFGRLLRRWGGKVLLKEDEWHHNAGMMSYLMGKRAKEQNHPYVFGEARFLAQWEGISDEIRYKYFEEEGV